MNPIRAQLITIVRLVEDNLDRQTQRELLPMQPGYVPENYADIGDLLRRIRSKPNTSIVNSICEFVD